MRVLNKGKRKVLRSKNLDLIFPSGISEQPNINAVNLFISSNSDISLFQDDDVIEPNTVDIKPKIEEPKPSIENKKPQYFSKNSKKRNKQNSKKESIRSVINKDEEKEW